MPCKNISNPPIQGVRINAENKEIEKTEGGSNGNDNNIHSVVGQRFLLQVELEVHLNWVNLQKY